MGYRAYGQPAGELVITHRPAGQLGELPFQCLDAHEQPTVLDQKLISEPTPEPYDAKRRRGTKGAVDLRHVESPWGGRRLPRNGLDLDVPGSDSRELHASIGGVDGPSHAECSGG